MHDRSENWSFSGIEYNTFGCHRSRMNTLSIPSYKAIIVLKVIGDAKHLCALFIAQASILSRIYDMDIAQLSCSYGNLP